MKKFTLLHLIIVGVIALIAGLLIGMAVYSPGLKKEDLSGSIGKVDRYRNVKVTEEDVQLRNELADDTAKLKMYEKYLTYFYYKSVRTSKDIEQVLKKSQEVDNFYKNSETYVKNLTNHKEFLDNTRPDILNALNMLITLNKDSNVPLVGYLNISQNAINRIRNQGTVLMHYRDAVNAFIAEVPSKTWPGLEDASDILTLNMMELAVMAQDKPVLKYLENNKLKNDEQGLKEFKAEEQFRDIVQSALVADAESLGMGSTEQLNNCISDMEKINIIVFSAEQMGSTLCNDIILQVVANAEQLGFIMSDTQLGIIESIGSDIIMNTDQLNLAADADQLKVII